METARMPGVSIAAMKPAASAWTIAVLTTGWPARMGLRTTVPFIASAALASPLWVMKLESTAPAGHFSQRTCSGCTAWPG